MVSGAISRDPAKRVRLERDAHAVQACTHPSVSVLFDVGEEEGRLYLVFEFVPGDPLEALMARGPLNPRRAVEIAMQVADGLADAHAAGLLHADLRPGTIVMTPKGNAKVYNIGLVRVDERGSVAVRVARAAPRRPGRGGERHLRAGRHPLRDDHGAPTEAGRQARG